MRRGDRVQIALTYDWARGATGWISEDSPEIYENPDTAKRHVTYQVYFDEPQYDADGDGPYAAGAIDVEALTVLKRPSVLDRLRRRHSWPRSK